MARTAIRPPRAVMGELVRRKRAFDKAQERRDQAFEEMIDEGVRMHLEDGWPLQAIADVVGLTKSRIHQKVQEARQR